jgi:hypothetical protein
LSRNEEPARPPSPRYPQRNRKPPERYVPAWWT